MATPKDRQECAMMTQESKYFRFYSAAVQVYILENKRHYAIRLVS